MNCCCCYDELMLVLLQIPFLLTSNSCSSINWNPYLSFVQNNNNNMSTRIQHHKFKRDEILLCFKHKVWTQSYRLQSILHSMWYTKHIIYYVFWNNKSTMLKMHQQLNCSTFMHINCSSGVDIKTETTIYLILFQINKDFDTSIVDKEHHL